MLFLSPLKELVETGWIINLTFGKNDDGNLCIDTFYASIGDSNCHIKKEYDPIDHHGWSIVEEDLSMDMSRWNPNDVIVWLYYACKEKEKSFGKEVDNG